MSNAINLVPITPSYPITRLGGGAAGHHFFGYYNKVPWHADGTRVLANRVNVMQAELGPHFAAQVGYFDLRGDGKFRTLGETTTWNFQMGCQLQWLENTRSSVIYNTRCFTPKPIYPDFAATILDVDTGVSRQLPLPVYIVATSGEFAMCISYDRLQHAHPTIGYLPHTPRRPLELAPSDDGIRRMDLATGEHALIVSLRQLREFHPVASMERAFHWVTHLEIAPNSKRFLFLHRWTECIEDETRWLHRLITVDADGSNLRLLECGDHPLPPLPEPGAPKAGIFDYEKAIWQISHPAWRGNDQIIVWGPHNAQARYHLYTDGTDKVEIIGDGVLTENGHMTYSPCGRWLLSDTYPDDSDHRLLIVFDTHTGQLHELARLYTDPALGKVNRCDLHPRWSRDGRSVCVDSVHERERQMYVVDVSRLVDA
ncbi:MAG: hypothetical protein JSR65_03950 [Proteobacteria bacterium]|nr:hypothetical protein [Pseudomonadota bacterium]